MTILFKSAQWSSATTKKCVCLGLFISTISLSIYICFWQVKSVCFFANSCFILIRPLSHCWRKLAAEEKGVLARIGEQPLRSISSSACKREEMCAKCCGCAYAAPRVRNVTPKSSKTDDGCMTRSHRKLWSHHEIIDGKISHFKKQCSIVWKKVSAISINNCRKCISCCCRVTHSDFTPYPKVKSGYSNRCI